MVDHGGSNTQIDLKMWINSPAKNGTHGFVYRPPGRQFRMNTPVDLAFSISAIATKSLSKTADHQLICFKENNKNQGWKSSPSLSHTLYTVHETIGRAPNRKRVFQPSVFRGCIFCEFQGGYMISSASSSSSTPRALSLLRGLNLAVRSAAESANVKELSQTWFNQVYKLFLEGWYLKHFETKTLLHL